MPKKRVQETPLREVTTAYRAIPSSEEMFIHKVGGAFKACAHCAIMWSGAVMNIEGEIVRMEKPTARSGYEVYKSERPSVTGWTYHCMACGASDEKCWEGFVAEKIAPVLNPSQFERGARVTVDYGDATPSEGRVAGVSNEGCLMIQFDGDPALWAMAKNDKGVFWCISSSCPVVIAPARLGRNAAPLERND